MALTLSVASLSPAACSEHELIEAARDGNDRAFEELYARYRGRVCAFIQGRVGDHGRAEDVAQEVFISALRRLRANDQSIQFKPWIYEIAKNACIDEFRRSRRAREVSLDADQDSAAPRPLLSLAPTPPAAIETKQRMADLRGAFGGLSESHHQLLVLREFEGLSYEAIGERTGMSRQMVESALFRARRKLSEEYNELASGRRCEQIQTAIEDGRALSARAFGLRERRQFARHLAHCQPCRAKAHLAGVDDSLVRPRSIGAKIAALLPFPLLRWPFGRAARAARNAALDPSSQMASALSEPGASALGGAAVAAAALALAGAGVLAGAPSHGHQALHRTATIVRSHPASAASPLSPTAVGSVFAVHPTGALSAFPLVGWRHSHVTPLARAGARPAPSRARAGREPRRPDQTGRFDRCSRAAPRGWPGLSPVPPGPWSPRSATCSARPARASRMRRLGVHGCLWSRAAALPDSRVGLQCSPPDGLEPCPVGRQHRYRGRRQHPGRLGDGRRRQDHHRGGPGRQLAAEVHAGRLSAGRRPGRDPASPVGYCPYRGVAQPGSAHRSGR